MDTSLVREVHEVLKKMEEINPQYRLNGTQNIWIAKPGGLSRGRGIKVIRSLAEIIEYTVGTANGT